MSSNKLREKRALHLAAQFFPNSQQLFKGKPSSLERTCRSLLCCPCVGLSLEARYWTSLDIQNRGCLSQPNGILTVDLLLLWLSLPRVRASCKREIPLPWYQASDISFANLHLSLAPRRSDECGLASHSTGTRTTTGPSVGHSFVNRM